MTAVSRIFNQIDKMTQGQATTKPDSGETTESKEMSSPLIYQYQQNTIESLSQQNTIESLSQQIETLKATSNKHYQVALELNNSKKAFKEQDKT